MMPKTHSHLLTVQNLSISFGENVAVNNLSFGIKPGQTLAIVGESGSGKSVSSLALMGLLPETATVTADSLQFGEVDLLKADAETHRKLRGSAITMIFQEPMTSLNPAMRCGRQVAEVLLLHKKTTLSEAKKSVLNWFEKVKLPDPESVFQKYPHQLSGGQRQRVMIAMAMCTKPKLLIADEPTTALDVTVQQSILRLLRELQREMGMAMLFITHDLGVVKEIADDVLVLYKGKMQELAPVADIFTNPKAPYTRGLLACRPPINQKPKRLATVADFLEFEVRGSKFDVSGLRSEVRGLKTNMEHATFNIQRSTFNIEPTLGQSEEILRIEKLHKYFPKTGSGWLGKKEQVEVLKGISLKIYSGESLGLVGESGCGKSTLGRNIIRLLQPEKGHIFYKNQDITQLSGSALRNLRRQIQMIFQDPYASLNPKQTIGQAITEPMIVHNLHQNNTLRKQKAIELLEKVGLTAEQYNRYPHEFSGGQRQRIGIARALAVNPELIICDESVSALDVSVQAQVLNLLNDLKDEFGFTYLFISHDLSVVKYFCDRIAVLNKGEIVELDDAEKVFFNPQNSYTQGLIAAIPGR